MYITMQTLTTGMCLITKKKNIPMGCKSFIHFKKKTFA